MSINRNNNFASNPWSQSMYDLRNLLLPDYPNAKRGSAVHKKSILFVIGAAGIPSPEHPKAGYRRRLEILALQTGMNVKALQGHISELEQMGLLLSRGLGPNNPKLRLVDFRELNRVVTRQLQDRDKWMELHKDVDENSPRLLFVPENYHLRISNPWDAALDTTLVTPVVTPLDAPLGAQVVTPLDSITETNDQTTDFQKSAVTDCISLHGRDLACYECDSSADEHSGGQSSEIDPWLT